VGTCRRAGRRRNVEAFFTNSGYGFTTPKRPRVDGRVPRPPCRCHPAPRTAPFGRRWRVERGYSADYQPYRDERSCGVELIGDTSAERRPSEDTRGAERLPGDRWLGRRRESLEARGRGRRSIRAAFAAIIQRRWRIPRVMRRGCDCQSAISLGRCRFDALGAHPCGSG
jgi:hypothetical protein